MIAVLGSTGMLGSYICDDLEKSDKDYVGLSRKANQNFSFENPNEIIKILSDINPRKVINCVANTSIDGCEANQDLSFQINAETPGNISKFCYENKIKFLHISSDHFYKSTGLVAHSESNKVFPVNFYAKSKLAAEELILSNNPSALIIRTSIIGRSPSGSSFLDWLLNSIKKNDEILLFEDAFTSFIHCGQLSRLLLKVISTERNGIFNIASSDVFSKADFALLFAKTIKKNISYKLGSVSTLKTKRSFSCGLDSELARKEFNISLPDLQEVITYTIKKEGI